MGKEVAVYWDTCSFEAELNTHIVPDLRSAE